MSRSAALTVGAGQLHGHHKPDAALSLSIAAVAWYWSSAS